VSRPATPRPTLQTPRSDGAEVQSEEHFPDVVAKFAAQSPMVRWDRRTQIAALSGALALAALATAWSLSSSRERTVRRL